MEWRLKLLEINKIYNMDCIDGLDKIEKHSIDLVITDPPYDVDYSEKSKQLNKLQKGYSKQIKRDEEFIKLNINYSIYMRELFRVMKENSHLYIFCGQDQIPTFMTLGEEVGFKFSTLCLWLKNRQTFNLGIGFNYNHKTENILFFRKGTRKLNKLGLSNVFECKIKQKLIYHPTEKPVELIKQLVLNSSDENELVLDTFMGSGSTAIACLNTKRNYIGFELSKKYYEDCIKRISIYKKNKDWFGWH